MGQNPLQNDSDKPFMLLVWRYYIFVDSFDEPQHASFVSSQRRVSKNYRLLCRFRSCGLAFSWREAWLCPLFWGSSDLNRTHQPHVLIMPHHMLVASQNLTGIPSTAHCMFENHFWCGLSWLTPVIILNGAKNVSGFHNLQNSVDEASNVFNTAFLSTEFAKVSWGDSSTTLAPKIRKEDLRQVCLTISVYSYAKIHQVCRCSSVHANWIWSRLMLRSFLFSPAQFSREWSCFQRISRRPHLCIKAEVGTP